VLALNSSINIPSFRIYTPSDNTSLPQSSLGLGRQSSFLDYLYNSGKLASRSWALFWGREAGDNPLDGSLSFGGFDMAKTSGSNMTQPLSSLADMALCPSSLIAFVTDIQLKFSNGTNVSLFGQAPETAMRTCIKPDIPLITFPENIYNNFRAAAGGTYLGPSTSYKPWGLQYETAAVFDGDLTFTFSSSLEVTVSNDQLVIPEAELGTDRQLRVSSDSTREILIYNFEPGNADDMPLLGQVFLTGAYLLVDNDREQFTPWQANATVQEDLVVIPGLESSCQSSATSTHRSPASSSTASTTNAPVTSKEHSGQGLSSAATGGLVIGCVALAAIGAFLFWCLRRRRTTAKARFLKDADHAAPGVYFKPELPDTPLSTVGLKSSTTMEQVPLDSKELKRKPHELAASGWLPRSPQELPA